MTAAGNGSRLARGMLSVATVVAALCATGAQSATAAEASEDETLGEVVVTGSRIRGIAPVGSPVVSLDRSAIEESGAGTTSELIRDLPLVVGLGASETASSAQNGAANVTRGVSINLRGIGSNATLVLFGGRRMPPAGTQGQITDISVIPAIALERVELVADGGSAIYGSDAVTGVLNLIPRRNFTGAESALRFGAADKYTDWTISQLFGTNWDSGHGMIAIERNQHSSLRGYNRDFFTSDLRSRGGSDFRSQQCAPGTILVGTTPYAIPPGSTGTGLTASQFTAGTRNLCDNIVRGDIIPRLERTSIMASAEQQLGAGLTAFAEGFYSRRTFSIHSAGVTANLTVPNTNAFYFNPTGGTGPVTVQYDLVRDGGLPNDPGSAQSWLAVAGLRRGFANDWRAEAAVSLGQSTDVVHRTQNVNTTTTGINQYLASNNPAVAFNPYGVGANNATTIAAVRNGQFQIHGDTKLSTVSLQADGPLWQLPAGSLRMAVGTEYRRETLGGLLESGSTTAPVVVPSRISRHMYAGFAELFVPLFGASNATPGLRRLDLSIAGRHEKYSDFGNTTNPKLGMNWSPVDGLLVRSSWGKSFRAPGLGENDPKSSGYGLYGDTLPCSHRTPATTCFGIGLAGGNPDLKPEKATTWSVGVDLTPAALPGFRASLTYWDVKYLNQIVGLRGTAGLLTNPIYASYRTLDPTPAQVNALLSSGLPINSPINASQVTYIQDGRRQNVGGTFAKGIDLDLGQSWDLGGSRLRVAAMVTRIDSLKTAVAPGATAIEVVNTLNYPQRWRGRASVGWSRGAFDSLLTLNHVGSYRQTGVTPVRDIASYRTLDLHTGFHLDEDNSLSLTFDVQNLLDKEPPFVNLSGGYDPQTASPILRMVVAGLRKSW
jgi:iron complex outermembrane recepter protein